MIYVASRYESLLCSNIMPRGLIIYERCGKRSDESELLQAQTEVCYSRCRLKSATTI
ncbi:hypothetical protein ES707_09230 [subsurface metagenome]